MYRKLLDNPILVNLTFLLVVVAGGFAYYHMPREQEPSVNLNWLVVWTVWPGASAEDVEKRITDPLETELGRIARIRFISSTSRFGASNITVRFEDLDPRQFDKKVLEVRRAIQRVEPDLPEGAEPARVLELTSSDTFPTAVVVAYGLEDDERLRRVAQEVEKDLKRMPGVNRVQPWGLRDPELVVAFDPGRLIGLGISPKVLADTVAAYFHDLALGTLELSGQEWLVRLLGTRNDPSYLESLPLLAVNGEVPLGSVAQVRQGREKARQIVTYQGRPAVLYSVYKNNGANNLALLARIRDYLEERNPRLQRFGVQLALTHDQTDTTRNAIHIMENNALIGLALVMTVVALFLGGWIAFYTALGLVFSLAGTFWVLDALGETLNVTVLLGIVIVLGMLVDDAVVVAEAIHANLKKGMARLHAAVSAVQEMWVPVTTATLTTMAAFLPLMLLPGILGDFMRVVPLVVSVALAISLVESFWLLPAHVLHSRADPGRPGRLKGGRDRLIRRLRHAYTRLLLKVMRHPLFTLALGVLLAGLCVAALVSGAVKVNFFANDLFRVFYVNLEMPPNSALSQTNATLARMAERIRQTVPAEELANLTTMAGLQLTEKEPRLSTNLGQIMVSLPPMAEGRWSVDRMIETLRPVLKALPEPQAVSFLRRKTGPPAEPPINVKLRGDDIDQVRAATQALQARMAAIEGIRDLRSDDIQGGSQLLLRLNTDAVVRAGLDPAEIAQVLALYVDGLVVADMRYKGETWEVRIKARSGSLQDVEAFLDHPVGLPDGKDIPLGELVHYEIRATEGNIRHQDLRRAITLTADLDTRVTDTLRANAEIARLWQAIARDYPGVTLDFSGELDDIKESLDSMAWLFLLGLGLIYLILGTQFRSYLQPLIIFTTIPMAFTGVVLGLLLSQDPLSLITLYGIIALAGIAANDAIVLIATANRNLAHQMPLGQAIVLAARRRLLPILITTLTTMAGLFSLAAGWGGKSLLWQPVATAIVWGLAFSTLLTLFLIPPLYRLVQGRRKADRRWLPPPPPLHPQGGHDLHLEKELERLAEDPQARRHYQLGCRRLQQNKPGPALVHFEALAQAHPESHLAHLYAAACALRLGRREVARTHLDRAARLDPTDPRLAQLRQALDGAPPP